MRREANLLSFVAVAVLQPTVVYHCALWVRSLPPKIGFGIRSTPSSFPLAAWVFTVFWIAEVSH